MTEPDSSDSGNVGEIDLSLGEFVDENSSIFLVMGVFAALSVYISSLPKDGLDTEVVDAGVVSALIIAGILSLVLLWRILELVGGIDGIIDNLFTINNIDFLLFIIAYTYLLDSLIKIVVGRPQAVGAIATSLTIVALLFVTIVGVRIVRDRIEDHLPLDDEYVDNISFCFVLSLIWLGAGMLLDSHEGELRGVQELQNPTAWEAVSAATLLMLSLFRPFVGVVLMGFVVILLMQIASDIGEFLRSEDPGSD